VGASTPQTLGLFGDRLMRALVPLARDDEW
jgi:hypothetical protein